MTKQHAIYIRMIKGTAVLVLLFLAALFFSVECPIQAWFHIPCPGCHMTTAVYWLLQGDVETACYFHPGVFFLIPYMILTVYLYVRYSKDWWKCRVFIMMSSVMLICLMLIYGLRMSGIWQLA